MNSTGYEEDLFATEAERIISSHGQQLSTGETTSPLFLYYAMHLFHSPLCAPPELLEEFSFIGNEHRRYIYYDLPRLAFVQIEFDISELYRLFFVEIR